MELYSKKSELEDFITQFNKCVEKKYFLRKRPGFGLTEAEVKERCLFLRFNTFAQDLLMLKSSMLDEGSIPPIMAAEIAESYASVQLRAENKVDIKDCLPEQKLEKDSTENLKNQNPNLYKLYSQKVGI